MSQSTAPVPITRLKQIVTEACATVFGTVDLYEHSKSAQWNDKVINIILNTLIQEATTGPPGSPPAYKFAINSTIIQHVAPASGSGAAAKRGMHSACGAFWNNEQDGMWTYKWEKEGMKGQAGFDVITSVIWIRT